MKTKEEINKAFDKLVNIYNFNEKKIKNKYSHCYRVASISEYLATEIEDEYVFNKEDINLAYVIGLLHDIGKFEQITKHTLNNMQNLNHGKIGREIVENNIYSFIDNNIDILLDSIEQHNKYLPNICENKKEIFINLVRDADKLDIYYELESRIINIYDVQYTANINKEILKAIYSNQYIQSGRKDVNNNDNLCILLSYVFNIKYRESFKYLYEKQYINKIFSQLNILEQDKKIYIDILEILNKYIVANMK